LAIFIIVALQPLLKKRLFLAMKQKLIASFEKKRGSWVIVPEIQRTGS